MDFTIFNAQKNPCISKDLTMPVAGLEPARGCPQQILSLPRLPFRHTGFFTTVFNLITAKKKNQVINQNS